MRFFVTGTGTDVGKTYFSTLLLSFLKKKGQRPLYYKPIATGSSESTLPIDVPDCRFVSERVDCDASVSLSYSEACAPYAIKNHRDFREEHRKRIAEEFDRLISRKVPLVVEGIGGVAVPLWKDYWVSDLIKCFHLPVFLVAENFLGTINHTLLSIEHLQAKQIPILGFILNATSREASDPVQQNAFTIQESSSVPHLFTLDYGQKIFTQKQEDVLCSLLQN